MLDDCVAMARRLAAGRSDIAIGMGVCELVDNEGHTQSAQTLDWRTLDVVGAFAQIGPAVVESDVRAAALAEARFGSGRGVDELLFVTVGTGISCCLVLGGRAYAGARGNAICFGAPPVENAASGLALAAAGGRERAEEVLADPALDDVVGEAAAALGAGLAWLVNALDPGKVVIGGGLGLVERLSRASRGCDAPDDLRRQHARRAGRAGGARRRCGRDRRRAGCRAALT